jgi:hypothetical protein
MRTLPAITVCVACLAFGSDVPLTASDAELAAIDRARALLSSRGRIVAAVIVIDNWPGNAPSSEAFAAGGRIYVKSGSNILGAAVRSRRFDTALASLLLHEDSHLHGANELQALQIELDWLTSEGAANDEIQALVMSIDREHRKTGIGGEPGQMSRSWFSGSSYRGGASGEPVDDPPMSAAHGSVSSQVSMMPITT